MTANNPMTSDITIITKALVFFIWHPSFLANY